MEKKLWNDLGKESAYQENKDLYQQHIMEQYLLYVEMADRISQRRNLANVFFLSLNTGLLTAVGFLIDKGVKIDPTWLIIFPLVAILILCLVWWWLIRSYRNLNSAKFKVIGKMEEKLPSSPYWKAEWKELGEGKDIKKYLPLTVLENVVPIIFAMIYIAISLYLILMTTS